MAQEVKRTPLEIAKEKHCAALKAANDALAKKPVDFVAYNKAIGELDEAEKKYATIVANTMYDEYAKKDNPIIEILKAYSYKTIGHRETPSKDKDESKRIVSVDAVEKERQIDLLAFCKRAKLDTDWQYTASKFNQLMCLRAAKELGADCKQIASTYFLQDTVKKIEMGATPTSNTQVCKLLQRVIDEMMPNETNDGKAIYKCNNYDVAYLDDLYGKKSGKAKLTVRVSNDAFLRRILVDIAHRLVTGGMYGVDGYKIDKNKMAANA